MSGAEVYVVHYFPPLDLPLLSPSSVRIRTRLITLTKNNLAYAVRGGVLRWWHAFPVPASLTPPYNNADDWCIVPAWGIAEVIESNVDDISKGSRLYWLIPLSSYQHDLTLVRTETAGHFREISEHRKPLMNLYNRFILIDEVLKPRVDDWFVAAFTGFGSGHLLNRFVLLFDPHFKPIHPLGREAGKWDREDADLTSTVVVGLSTSSKTGRMFSWSLTQDRDPQNLPLGYLQLSTASEASIMGGQSAFPIKSMSYSDLASSEAPNWLAALQPTRVLLVDFGARDGIIERFLGSVSPVLPKTTSFTILALATKREIIQNPDPVAKEHLVKRQSLDVIQVNHSGIQDSAIEDVGVASVYEDWKAGFDRWVEADGAKTLELAKGSGIGGENGVEKSWEDLVCGRISFQKALIFHI
ncbi:hypothetical protein EDB81DRAFT_794327 [Dactylonectria macrodidyma]|uniref:Uncharacterized protein n=1 Tax=Dactylonectria macrodidyma TaxID=307937 RepID=A0A9P9J899_9HYPO|nr:hypothetical protein EDB81DRAFT_794327 [Dactylonectria macrodidyma]